MEEDIGELKQKMEELLKSYSQSPNAYVEEREHQQTGRNRRKYIYRDMRSNEASTKRHCSTRKHKACRMERTPWP